MVDEYHREDGLEEVYTPKIPNKVWNVKNSSLRETEKKSVHAYSQMKIYSMHEVKECENSGMYNVWACKTCKIVACKKVKNVHGKNVKKNLTQVWHGACINNNYEKYMMHDVKSCKKFHATRS